MRSTCIASALVALAIALVACEKSDRAVSEHEPPATTQSISTPKVIPTATTMAAGPSDAAKVFRDRCSACHGLNGKGDGPTAAILSPKPRDYSLAEWQKSVSDDDIRTVIIKGGPALGKSAQMPPSADLANNKETIDGLVAIVRGFASK